jgi:hypothetical protein
MINELLKSKSQEEIEDLERRGFRKNTGKWRFYISIHEILLEYEKNEDKEAFKNNIVNILSEKTNDIVIYAGKQQTEKYKEVINKFKEIKDLTVDALDEAMIDLYDWADDNDVWIESC